MDLSTTVHHLEREGFAVTFHRDPDDPGGSAHVAVGREGWFAARIRLPVDNHARPRLDIGVCADRKPDGFVFWTRSCMATPTRYLAVTVAVEFLRAVRLRW